MPHAGPPPLPLLLADAPRAASEAAGTLLSWPWLRTAPRGDGHAVLVLPGFLGGDAMTAPLRRFLRAQGFDARGWGHGINWGRWDALEAIVLPLVRDLAQRTGGRVSVLGASMSGLYAREAARRHPELVRCVVTFASAVQPPERANHVWPAYEALTRQHESTMSAAPAVVPSTSVFSRSDGLSDWRPCLLPAAACQENVGVFSSHLGMAVHPASLYLAADRLAQPPAGWRPFTPPPSLRAFFEVASPQVPQKVW